MRPLVFAMVCEATADFRTAKGLTERVICEAVDWVEVDHIPHFLQWHGRDQTSPFWLWREIGADAKEAGIKVRGHFDQEPGFPDARVARRALHRLRLLKIDGEPIDGFLLIRDDDGDRDRRNGLEQGRKSVPDLSGRIVIGLAHSKRECWVLLGFEPSEPEEEVVRRVRQVLGFDPCRESHRLRAKGDGEERNAKRVLSELTQGVAEREEVCWRETPLEVLRERGGPSGLTAFLDEVEERLVPLFTGRPQVRGDRAGG